MNAIGQQQPVVRGGGGQQQVVVDLVGPRQQPAVNPGLTCCARGVQLSGKCFGGGVQRELLGGCALPAEPACRQQLLHSSLHCMHVDATMVGHVTSQSGCDSTD